MFIIKSSLFFSSKFFFFLKAYLNFFFGLETHPYVNLGISWFLPDKKSCKALALIHPYIGHMFSVPALGPCRNSSSVIFTSGLVWKWLMIRASLVILAKHTFCYCNTASALLEKGYCWGLASEDKVEPSPVLLTSH